MIMVPFDSGNKFDGKCKIIFDENKLKTFDIINEQSILVRSYKLKTQIEENFKLKFFLICPNGKELHVRVNNNSVMSVIILIIINETADYNKEQLDQLTELINYISGSENEEE